MLNLKGPELLFSHKTVITRTLKILVRYLQNEQGKSIDIGPIQLKKLDVNFYKQLLGPQSLFLEFLFCWILKSHVSKKRTISQMSQQKRLNRLRLLCLSLNLVFIEGSQSLVATLFTNISPRSGKHFKALFGWNLLWNYLVFFFTICWANWFVIFIILSILHLLAAWTLS